MIATAVIPARLGSTRFPGKVMVDLCGKPLLWHVWNQARRARKISQVFIATDSIEVQEAVLSWGGQAVLTSPECRSGTERIASIIAQVEGDFIVNVQGDEPMIDPAMLDFMVEHWQEDQSDILTPVYRITHTEDLFNPNIVKVVRAQDQRAIYFSRSLVPYVRDQPGERWLEYFAYWGHIGVYGFKREVLENYFQLPESKLEAMERLEQLRFLEGGYSIQTFETSYQSVPVDTVEDLERVRELISTDADNNPVSGGG